MQLRHRYNPILLLWLLAAIAFFAAPARCFALCDMQSGKQSASAHDCCVKRSACDCVTPAQNAVQGAAQPIRFHADCACEMQPEPANSEPKTEAHSVVLLVVLPARAGPDFRSAARSVSIPLAPTPAPGSQFAPPAPSRAPPF